MQLSLSVDGLDKVRNELSQLTDKRLLAAVASTLNQVGGRVAKNMRTEMDSAFVLPTPYTLRSVKTDPATPDKLQVSIRPTYLGGKGIDPQQYLQSEAFGGRRALKRSEKALQRIGVLPAGYYTAIPKSPYPGSDDGRGNIRGPFMVRLLSYFQAFGEQGYRANSTAKGRKRLAAYTKSASGAKSIGGVVFFVSYGKLRSNANGHTSPLAPGIWAKSGTHGVNVKPVLMFIRTPNYAKRLDMDKIEHQTNPGELFSKWLRGNIRDQYRLQQSIDL